MKNRQRSNVHVLEGNGGEEDRNCVRVALKVTERLGEEWRKRAANRRNWRPRTENVMTEK